MNTAKSRHPLPDGASQYAQRKLAEKLLAFKTVVLRDTLEHMDQGISMVDSELRVVAWNRRFVELLDFPDSLFNEQTTFADVIRFNARRGEYGPGDVEEQVRQRVELARRFEPHVFERKRPDGTILEIRGNPLPGGGFVTTYTDVTARKRAEQAVRESEVRFRSLTELSSDWYWEQDENFRFVEFSAGADLRDTSSAHVGRTRWELPGVDGSEKRWAEHRETLAAHKAFRNFEFQRLTESGEVIWTSASGEPIFDEQGVFKGYRGVGSDITVRKLAEEALREQTERLQIGQKAARMIILDRDIPNDRLTWSDSPEWLRGPLPPSGQYPLFKDQIHPEDREKFLATRAVVIESLRGQTQEFRIVRTDGQVVWLLARQKVFADASGKARRMLVALFDITERKVAERALGESEERFRALCGLSSDLYWETDTEHRLTQYSYGGKIEPVVPVNKLLGQRRWEIPEYVYPGEEGWRAHRATLEAHLPFRDFEVAARRVDSGVRHFALSGEPMFDAAGAFIGYRGVGREITEQKTAEERLDRLAHYDTLTGLPNRALLHDRMRQAMARTDRGQTLLAVMFLDLDRFKEINDSLGHAAGDEVLKEAARRLQSCLRSTDTVARLGGDEFTVLFEDVRHVDEISALARKILDAFTEPAEVAGRELHLSTSIGIAVYPLDDHDADTLLRNADIAMYQAKQEGRNNFQFFAADMGARTERHADLRLRLHHALERGEFALHYQPQVALAGGAIFGVEALLRWNDAELGPVPPGQFISLAEEMGLIVPIGDWVLREACRQCKSWLDAGLGPLRVAVNLSPRQFRQKKLAQRIGEILRESGLPAACIEIEITEGIVMKHTERAIATLTELNQLGVQIAIDDFGTGYSSLAYLQRFPVHVLKIDQSFVQAIRGGTEAPIVNTVIHLAKLLGLKSLAEGVETAEQLEYLRAHGCDSFQGYLFCKPQPAEHNGELLAAHRCPKASALR